MTQYNSRGTMYIGPHKALLTFNLKSIRELPSVVDDFVMYGQLITSRKMTITDWVRERFNISANTTQNIEFGETDVVNFLYMETSDDVMLDIIDAGYTGFGQGGFGQGGFGGSSNPLVGFHVNGILAVEGRYRSMVMTNNNSTPVTVDLYAAVYEQAQ